MAAVLIQEISATLPSKVETTLFHGKVIRHYQHTSKQIKTGNAECVIKANMSCGLLLFFCFLCLGFSNKVLRPCSH